MTFCKWLSLLWVGPLAAFQVSSWIERIGMLLMLAFYVWFLTVYHWWLILATFVFFAYSFLLVSICSPGDLDDDELPERFNE